MIARSLLPWLLAVCATSSFACRKTAPQEPVAAPPPPSGRIDVPEAVRKNLGITFAKVERRALAATLRLPGHFELLPQARAEHRVPFAGRVTVLVAPLQRVAAGDVLVQLDAPEWRTMQQQLGELEAEATVTAANLAAMQPLLDAHRGHEESLQTALTVIQERLKSLEATQGELGGQAQNLTDARVQLAQVQTQIAEAAEQHTETAGKIARFTADRAAFAERRELLLAAAAAALGTTVDALLAPAGSGPRWRTLATIEIRAAAAGAVETLPATTGAWVDAHALVATTVDPTAVRFRAPALQGDLGRVRDGLPAAVIPAGATDPAARVTGALQLDLTADPSRRTLDVFVVPTTTAAFARAGVAGFVEIETASTSAAELCIPRSCVLPDGLGRVFFRRDPREPDQVIRVDADLGLDDGRWVEVKSGVLEGDEVVSTGAYELVLATARTGGQAGHYHADGTWHAGEHK
jgi:hypothetical protein